MKSGWLTVMVAVMVLFCSCDLARHGKAKPESELKNSEKKKCSEVLMAEKIIIPADKSIPSEAVFQQRKSAYLYRELLGGKTYDAETAGWLNACCQAIANPEYSGWQTLWLQGEKLRAGQASDPSLRVFFYICLSQSEHEDEALKELPKIISEPGVSDSLRMVGAAYVLWLEPDDAALSRNIVDDDIVGMFRRGAFNDPQGMRIFTRIIDDLDLSLLFSALAEAAADNNKIDPWFRYYCEGQKEIYAAWEARGNGPDDTVSEEGNKGFDHHLGLAREALVKAWKLHPEWPEAASYMIVVTMGGNGEKDLSVCDWFNRSVKAQIDYRYAYSSILCALLPRWNGCHEAMLVFGRKALNSMRYDTMIPQYYYKSLMKISSEQEHYSWQEPFRNKPEVKAELIRFFDDVIRHEADPMLRGKWLARYAVLMIGCGDWDKAAAVMRLVPPSIDFKTIFPRENNHGYRHLNQSRADWEFMLDLYRGPAGKMIARAESRNIDDNVKSMRNAAAWAARQVKDQRGREWIADHIALMEVNRSSGITGVDVTGMCRAAGWDDMTLLNLLYSFPCDVNRPSSDGKTPLHYAVMYSNNPAMVERLLDLGADINRSDDDGFTPLLAAVENGDIDLFLLLLARGADLKHRDNDGWNALIYALVHATDPGFLRILLKKGVDLDVVVKGGNTPLLEAALHCPNAMFIEMIYARKPEINHVNDRNENALMLACANNAYEVAKFVLERGIDVRLISAGDGNALHYSVRRNDHPEMIKLLLQYGCGINERDKKGDTPLHKAITEKHFESARVLVANNCDLNIRNEATLTPLDVAIQYASPDFAEYLIKRGADVKLRDGDGRGVVYRASQLNNLEMVQMLVANGAEVNVKDNHGKTALDVAKSDVMRKYLSEHGAKSGKL